MHKVTLSLFTAAATLAAAGTSYAQQSPAAQPHERTRAGAQQRADQMFDRLDANHDGKIDQADRAIRQKARFDGLDTDHNGQLSYAEFTAARDARNGRGDGKRGDRAGRRGDHRMAMGGFHGRGGFRTMRMADADKDGAITKAEFETSALQRFDRMDGNHDGTVTPDEAKAARDNMRQEWQAHRQDRAG